MKRMVVARRPAWHPATRWSLGAVLVAAAACLAAAVEAWRLDSLPAFYDASPGVPMLPDASPGGSRASDARVLAAVARHPFRPDRSPPSMRYRLPGEARAAAAEPSPWQRLAGLRLLGTVARAEEPGMAALQLPGRPPRVVRVGEWFEGLKLVSVTRGSATLVGADTTLVLRLAMLLPEDSLP